MKARHDWPDFAQRLKAVRQGAELTMQECSRGTEIPYKTYCSYERGDFRPKHIQTYQVLANFFKISVSWLAFGPESKPPQSNLPAKPNANFAGSTLGSSKAFLKSRSNQIRPDIQSVPLEKRFVAYIRVSTPRQALPGTSLISQRLQVRRFIDRKSGTLVGSYRELESARRLRGYRPALAQAISECRRSKATLIVTTMDRLTRNVAFLSQLIESGVEVVVLDLPEANRLTLHIAAALAEHESESISEYGKAVSASKRLRGLPPSCLRISRADRLRGWYKAGETSRAKARELDRRVVPLLRTFRAAGITSRPKMAHLLNEGNVPTARGGRWSHGTVAAIEARMTPPAYSALASSVLARRRAFRYLSTIREIFKSGRTSYRQICNELNRRKILSPGGSAWQPSIIARVLAQCNSPLRKMQTALLRKKGVQAVTCGYRFTKAAGPPRLAPSFTPSVSVRRQIILPPEFQAPVCAAKFVAYLRVSDGRKRLSGLGENAQRSAVRRFAKDKGRPIIAEFVEYESAYKFKSRRTQLLKAIDLCQRENAALIVARMHRLSRNVAFIANLMESDIEFHALDNPSANRLTGHILAANAEYDSFKKSQRAKLANAVRRAQGRPPGGFCLWSKSRQRREHRELSIISRKRTLEFAKSAHPVIDQLRAEGFTTYREIAAGLALKGISTRRKKAWNVTSVRDVDMRGRDVLQTVCPQFQIPVLIKSRYYASVIKGLCGSKWLSYEEIASRLNEMKLLRPRHGLWHGYMVSRELARANIKRLEYVQGGHRCTYLIPPVKRLARL